MCASVLYLIETENVIDILYASNRYKSLNSQEILKLIDLSRIADRQKKTKQHAVVKCFKLKWAG